MHRVKKCTRTLRGMKKAVLVLSTILAFPCQAGELDDIAPSTQVYLRIPLGPAASGYDRKPSFGLAFKNGNASQTFMLDSRLVESTYRSYQAGIAAGVEVQWLIVGAVAAGAAVVIASRTKAE